MDQWMKEQGDQGHVIGTPKLLASAKEPAPDTSKSTAPASPKKPNIIFLLTDDMGVGDLSCYGGTIQATPKTTRPMRNSRRRPTRSASRPAGTSKAAKTTL